MEIGKFIETKKRQFLLTLIYVFITQIESVQVLDKSLKGNPVKIGDGPASVIGDKSRKMPLCRWKRDGKAR